MRIVLSVLCCMAVSCAERKTVPDKQVLTFGSFTIETPAGWTKIKARGMDSYVGRIAIDKTDTLDFDLGWYSNTLTEPEPVIWDSSMIGLIDTTFAAENEIIFVKNRMRVDPDKYKKNNISWDTIDGRIAKIVSPRKSGIGTTGIYIDSLWQSGSDADRFNLYGVNLQPANEKMLLQALQTLKFHKPE